MARVQRARARKEYTCRKCGKKIAKGEVYCRGNIFRQRNPIIACSSCGLKPYELSTSGYVQSVGRIVEDWEADYGVTDGAWEAIGEALQEVKDSCEESLENMPEGLREGDVGSLLQERIDTLEEAISQLTDYDSMSDFLSRGFDGCSEESQRAIEAETDKRAADRESFYQDFWDGSFAADLQTKEEKEQYRSAAEEWQENTENEIREFIEQALGEISY